MTGGQSEGATGAAAAQAYVRLGNLAREQGDTIRRSSSTKPHKRPTPPRWPGTSSLLRFLTEQGKAEQALTQLETAVRNNPTSAEAAFELVALTASKSAPKEAIKQLERAVELKPGYVEAYMQLSQAAADIKTWIGPRFY